MLSDVVWQFLEQVAFDAVSAFYLAFDVKSFVALHKLEMDDVAFGEAFQRFAAGQIRLVFKVFRLEELIGAVAFQYALCETVKIVAVGPFAGKEFRVLYSVDNHFEDSV